MNRRNFLNIFLGAAGGVALADRADAAGLPKARITRIRYYKTPTDAAGRPNSRQPLFNQSTNVVLVEMVMGGTRQWPYLNHGYDFKNGKLWPNERPGLGVEVDVSQLQLIGDYKERYTLTPLLKSRLRVWTPLSIWLRRR